MSIRLMVMKYRGFVGRVALFAGIFLVFHYLVIPRIISARHDKRYSAHLSSQKTTEETMIETLMYYKPLDVVSSNGMWQVVNDPLYEVYLFSAFFDDRPSLKKYHVRIIGVAEPLVEDMSCLLWYRNRKEPDAVPVTITYIGEKVQQHNKIFQGALLSCVVPALRWPPEWVSIVAKDSVVPSNLVQVELPFRPPMLKDIAVCVPPMYNSISEVRLTEWIEVLHHLGVTKIVIYDNGIKESTLRIIRHYAEKGMTEVRKARFPMDGENITLSRQLLTAATINDCFYRNMMEHSKITVLDVDEIIVPRIHDSYPEMVTYIDDTLPTHPGRSYIFKSVFFWLDFEPFSEDTPFMTVTRYFMRTPPSSMPNTQRSITDTQTCMVLYTRKCQEVLPSYKNLTDWLVPVNMNISLLHHYKKCDLDQKFNEIGLCNKTMEIAEVDATGTKFVDKVVTPVVETLWKFDLVDILNLAAESVRETMKDEMAMNKRDAALNEHEEKHGVKPDQVNEVYNGDIAKYANIERESFKDEGYNGQNGGDTGGNDGQNGGDNRQNGGDKRQNGEDNGLNGGDNEQNGGDNEQNGEDKIQGGRDGEYDRQNKRDNGQKERDNKSHKEQKIPRGHSEKNRGDNRQNVLNGGDDGQNGDNNGPKKRYNGQHEGDNRQNGRDNGENGADEEMSGKRKEEEDLDVPMDKDMIAKDLRVKTNTRNTHKVNENADSKGLPSYAGDQYTTRTPDEVAVPKSKPKSRGKRSSGEEYQSDNMEEDKEIGKGQGNEKGVEKREENREKRMSSSDREREFHTAQPSERQMVSNTNRRNNGAKDGKHSSEQYNVEAPMKIGRNAKEQAGVKNADSQSRKVHRKSYSVQVSKSEQGPQRQPGQSREGQRNTEGRHQISIDRNQRHNINRSVNKKLGNKKLVRKSDEGVNANIMQDIVEKKKYQQPETRSLKRLESRAVSRRGKKNRKGQAFAKFGGRAKHLSRNIKEQSEGPAKSSVYLPFPKLTKEEVAKGQGKIKLLHIIES